QASYSESRFQTHSRAYPTQTHTEDGNVSATRSIQPQRPADQAPQPAQATPAGTPDRRRIAAIIAVLALAVFMSNRDLFIVNLAFPYIGREYPGTSLGSLSWVLNAYTIVFAAVLVPAGRWADRVGRRRVFTIGLIMFTVGSLLCGISPGVGELIGARI